MRRDVLDLRDFYATPLGQAAQALIARKLAEAWGRAEGLDLMGLGYAAPYLGAFARDARRAVAAMPAAQGVEAWPAGGRNLAVLGDEYALPFGNALFDRVLVIHALEEADDPVAMLREVWRVMAPSGRMIVAAANRVGFWSDAEATPFGHGRPYTRNQLETLVREADLEPLAWSRALFGPPLQWTARWAEGFEQAGARLWPGLSGLILLEAVKRTFAVRPRGRKIPARVFVPGALAPSPARKAVKSRALERS
ncbi:MAG: methyltransferase domain-containing protein [Caulobacteraceae bacterium]|nr:methyltransferase domain-containing protein [Caulobacteraceae bacterium]